MHCWLISGESNLNRAGQVTLIFPGAEFAEFVDWCPSSGVPYIPPKQWLNQDIADARAQHRHTTFV